MFYHRSYIWWLSDSNGYGTTFAHTDLYVKDGDNNNEEESLQESER